MIRQINFQNLWLITQIHLAPISVNKSKQAFKTLEKEEPNDQSKMLLLFTRFNINLNFDFISFRLWFLLVLSFVPFSSCLLSQLESLSFIHVSLSISECIFRTFSFNLRFALTSKWKLKELFTTSERINNRSVIAFVFLYIFCSPTFWILNEMNQSYRHFG